MLVGGGGTLLAPCIGRSDTENQKFLEYKTDKYFYNLVMYYFIFTQISFVKPLNETVYSLVEFQMRLGCRPPPKIFCSYTPAPKPLGLWGTSPPWPPPGAQPQATADFGLDPLANWLSGITG